MTLSIITINLNNADGLERTLASVARQQPAEMSVEHVIIDGASADSSVERIRAYAAASHPYKVVWVSEPDKGIYNAMNKGIRMAEGDYIQVLNSGDCYAAEDVVMRMAQALQAADYPALLYGNMIRLQANGAVQNKSGQLPYSLWHYYCSTMNHNCCWIQKQLFEQYGYYDEELRIVSDWKWFLQVIGLGNVRPVYSDIDVTHFDLGGISEQQLALRNAERRKVLEELLPPAVLADLDRHAFDIEQMNRLRKHHLYGFTYLIERTLFKLEKWHILK